MKKPLLTLTVVLFVGCFFAPLAHGADTDTPIDVASAAPGRASTPVTAANLPTYLDEDLASKHADFSKFARTWIRTSNQHHIYSRNRMKIKRQPDGTFSATFHRSDENDVVCTVRKNISSGVYTAVLRYKEVIYKTIATSADECRTNEFLPSLVNRRIRIFKLKGNTWQ